MIGILGGGQLGRMLALAAIPLGQRVRVLEPDPDAPAAAVAEHIVAEFADPRALSEFAHGCDVVTFEFENVPISSVEQLARSATVHPSAKALEVCQDRLSEKSFFRSLGIATPNFHAVASLENLKEAAREVGLPAVLKTRRLGYDGKGQRVLHRMDELADVMEDMGEQSLLLEAFVPFDRELSIVAARDQHGQIAYYPVVENRHEGGILHSTTAPAPGLSPALELEARTMIAAILEKMAYVGVAALELFEHRGTLLVNEMAPRVHNSGHWTIEGAQTSQFENHIRAVVGLPLGSTEVVAECVMINLVGETPATADVLRIPGAHLHLYEKEARPGRKLGHITIRGGPDFAQSVERVLSLVAARTASAR